MSGQVVNSDIEADSREQAASKLLSNGITPITIDPVATSQDPLDSLTKQLLKKRATLDDLILFCRQANALTRSGVPIIRAFTGLIEGTPNEELSNAIRDMITSLQSGRTLAAAMNDHPDVFPPIFVNMVQVGEQTGNLDASFAQLAFYLDLEKETRNRVKSALRYPSFVIIAIIVAMGIMNVFVIPAFSKVFAGFGAELPLPTQILLATSEFSVNYWPHICVAMFGAFMGARYYLKTPVGALWWDEKKMSLPIVGSILLRATLARFARAFAMASRSGIPILQAMNSVSQAVDNLYVAEKIDSMRLGIEKGDTLTRTAAATHLFTPLVLQMMAVGEETGAMDTLMQEVAEFYEREVDYELKSLSSAIEPILLTVVGIMVLVLALGIFLPMWDLGSAAMKK